MGEQERGERAAFSDTSNQEKSKVCFNISGLFFFNGASLVCFTLVPS